MTWCVQAAGGSGGGGGGGGVQSDVVFEEMAAQVSSSPDLVQKVKAIYLWTITDSEGKTVSQWSEWGRNAGIVHSVPMYCPVCAAVGGCLACSVREFCIE